MTKKRRLEVLSDEATAERYASSVVTLTFDVLHEGAVGNEALAQAALAIAGDALVRSGLVVEAFGSEAKGERPSWAGREFPVTASA